MRLFMNDVPRSSVPRSSVLPRTPRSLHGLILSVVQAAKKEIKKEAAAAKELKKEAPSRSKPVKREVKVEVKAEGKEEVKVKKEKKVFSLPGQTKDTPPEVRSPKRPETGDRSGLGSWIDRDTRLE